MSVVSRELRAGSSDLWTLSEGAAWAIRRVATPTDERTDDQNKDYHLPQSVLKDSAVYMRVWRRWAELLVRCHPRLADAVLFARVACPRCVHRISMSDDSQITVGAQSELSQSYSQSSVRAGVFPRKFVFLKKSLFPLLLKRLGGCPIFTFDRKNPALTEL